MANHPDTLQSSRRIQRSSAFVRTTWLYRPDAIQCLTSIRVSTSRHSYGKMAATFRTMCDPVWTMFSIRQHVHTKFMVRTVVFMVRTIKLHIWKLRAPVQPSGCQPLGSGRSKPYYGNYVQPKCNRPDARATPSGCGLVMEAFSAILKRRLQLTVRTLGQAVWTPSGILIITFYSNIRLGRNWCRWKAMKNDIN
jgi:hypothetical protein